MTPGQWHRIKEIFEAALEHAPEDRSAFLFQACREDESVRTEVESLLSSYEQERNFLEKPAVEIAAESLAKEESVALVGQQLGHFQIRRQIGRGGMGVVYLAQDFSLQRPVALKLLPKHLTSDPSRLRRFEREARAASALNHPNILTIHEIAELDGRQYIATEFVDGPTLRERINSKDLELDEALNIAEQIASALVAAHDAGIVHRDIKPENVMLRHDGYVKLLDFGLAKLTQHEAVEAGTPSSATAGMTDTGVMGTVGYMSPEQVQGLSVDERTDIFSLGVVIYEMVTSQRPFAGDNTAPTFQQDALPLSHYVAKAPTELQRIVTRSLRHDRDKRYQTMAELLADLKSLRSKRPARFRFTAARLVLLFAVFSVVTGLWWVYSPDRTANRPLSAMKILPFTSYEGEEYLPAFSPDGKQIAFSWNGERTLASSIYVKQIGVETPLRLTFDSSYHDWAPAWSPDGQRIAFLRRNESEISIFVVPVGGGTAQKLVTLGAHPEYLMAPTLAWSSDGKFIALPYTDQGPPKIVLVSPETLAKHNLTNPPAATVGDFGPMFSPDGQSVAFFRMSSTMRSADIYTVPIRGGEPRRLTFDNAFVSGLDWTRDGREIVFGSNRTDSASASDLSGGWRQDASGLWRISVLGGTPEQILLNANHVYFPRIARQGNRLTYVQDIPEDENIYAITMSNATVSKDPPTKLIASTQFDGGPQFSPDGRRITFHSNRSGQLEIWICDSDGTNLMQLTSSGANKRAGTPRWSPDGHQIAFDVFEKDKGAVYVIGVDDHVTRPVASGASTDHLASWSRDGKWIYFASDRTGRDEVWKASVQGSELLQVTTRGGELALESFDGRYLYYTKPFPTLGIWRKPLHGGEEVRILDSFDSSLSGDWALTNNGIYFINEDAEQGVSIQFFDFASRKTSLVAHLGKIRVSYIGIAVSPDGRQILYTQQDQYGADITLVEDFR